MKVTKIRISNVLGVESLELQPGTLTEISGGNGAGKTSILEAIKAVMDGGHDATLIRQGAESGEIVLVLDDGMEITKKIAPARSTLSVADEVGKMSSPATRVKALVDALSVNPIEFLTASKKDRVSVLLESMPIELDQEKLDSIAGSFAKGLKSKSAWDVLEEIKKSIFNERAGQNRVVKEKRATASQLDESLPSLPEDAQNLDYLLEKLKRLDIKVHAEISNVTDAHKAEAQVFINEANEQRQAFKQRIKKLEDEINCIKDERSQILDEISQKITQIEHKSELDVKDIQSKFESQKSDIRSEIQLAKRNAEIMAESEKTKSIINSMNEEADAGQKVSEEYTQKLKDLESYKSELLASLPIPGLEVTDGEIFLDGIPFDRLNTAKQIWIAVEIAKLRAGKLGLICVDGAERLDEKSYAEFCDQAESSGLQLVVTRVSEGPLKVKAS